MISFNFYRDGAGSLINYGRVSIEPTIYVYSRVSKIPLKALKQTPVRVSSHIATIFMYRLQHFTHVTLKVYTNTLYLNSLYLGANTRSMVLCWFFKYSGCIENI
jgi:hypothetical protein